jgi:hypothetical protein
MKIRSIAIAAASFCAVGAVSAQTLTINAGGASATRATITNAVIESGCGAAGITLFQQGTNVTRITCPINATLAAALPSTFTALDFSYDNTTGSYLGIGPVSGNNQNVLRLNIGATTTCAVGGNSTIAGKTVLVRTGCGTAGETAVRPTIGNADVEPDMFTGALAPASVGAFIPDGITASGQYGVIFGMAASLPLYRALQTEQGKPLTDLEADAPNLTTAQIVSLTTNNGGPLNQTWEALFPNTAAANANDTQTVRFVRRVAGSGSHATFSSQFLATNCSSKGLVPAAAGDSVATYTVLEYGATGNQLSGVDSVGPFPTVTAAQGSANAVALSGTAKPANYYAVGYASLENAPAASGNGSGWRFVRVDGLYPSKTNVQNGNYNWMAEQVLTQANTGTGPQNFGVNATSLAAVPGFFGFLASATGSANVIANFSLPTRNGIVALPFVADAGEANYLAQRTRFRTFGNSCVRPFAVE